jgi:ClpP class serine protease
MDNNELFFENETRKHQQEVARLLMTFATKLLERAAKHDDSKLLSPEREVFIKNNAKLKGLTYGSEEYKQCLADMKVALNSHYANNPHHPEFNTVNFFDGGLESPVTGMHLVDVVEMLCDWMASTKRHADGNIAKSININEERFNISPQLSQVFRNTTPILEES